MTNNLRRNRRPFSLEDSLCELNLSISEFVDFVRWANVSTVVPIPHDRTVRMFYENENFSLTPQYYQGSEREHQAEYLQIPSATLETIAIGGRKEISRFDAIISTSGKSISTEELHESVHNCFVEYNHSSSLTTASRSERIKAFYHLYTAPYSLEKWFGITLPRPASPPSLFQQDVLLPSSSSALSWVNQSQRLTATAAHSSTFKDLQTDVQHGFQMEFFLFSISDSLPSTGSGPIPIWVDKTNILFLPSQIYALKEILEALPSQCPNQRELTKLDVLNNAALKFHATIKNIKENNEASRYWREHSETSNIASYLRANIKLKSESTIEYCTRVLIDDNSLFEDPKPAIEVSPKKYPRSFSDALIRLNEARPLMKNDSSDKNIMASKQLKDRLEKIGFKSRAANLLKAILKEPLKN